MTSLCTLAIEGKVEHVHVVQRRRTDLPVVNRTALSGLFSLATEGWRPMRLPPPPPSGNPPAAGFDDLPTIFAVLGKLGLDLKQQEATVPFYAVEHIERPAGE